MEPLKYNPHVFSLICLYQMRLFNNLFIPKLFYHEHPFPYLQKLTPLQNVFQLILRVSPGPRVLKNKFFQGSSSCHHTTFSASVADDSQELTASPKVTTGSNPFQSTGETMHLCWLFPSLLVGLKSPHLRLV